MHTVEESFLVWVTLSWCLSPTVLLPSPQTGPTDVSSWCFLESSFLPSSDPYTCFSLPFLPSFFHFVKTCIPFSFWLSHWPHIIPPCVSLALIILFLHLLSSFLQSLQGKENHPIIEFNTLTSITYMSFFSCTVCTHMHTGSLQTQTSVIVFSVPVTSITDYPLLFFSWPDWLSQSKHQTGLYD